MYLVRALLLTPLLVGATQTAFEAVSTTLIDVLNADEDYTSLIHLLQRAKLVPTLNRVNGSTLFAPTNDAIERHSFWRNALDADLDNVNEKLRQDLFYHLINYTVPRLPEEDHIRVLKTLHFPQVPVEPPSREPPPLPPWMPIPGGTLDGEPQRLRLSSREVGVDAFGKGGVKLVKDGVNASNGVVYGIGEVLDVPDNLARVVSQQPHVSYFQSLLTPVTTGILNSTPAVTLFLPVNEAWNVLDSIERRYLESEYAADDLIRILRMHAVTLSGVHWSDSFGSSLNLTTLDGTTLEVTVSDGKTTVTSAGRDSADVVQPDIYASNGVVHTVSSLLFPSEALQLTPEKYLLTLNCTRFVSLLHSANLTTLINNTDTVRTVLAPSDDVLSLLHMDDLPERGSEELQRLLRYHFIPGKWTQKKLKDRMLIETELMERGLDGGRQVLDIEVTEEKGGKDKAKSVRFGGAGVIGDPIEVNNTLIYFVSRPLVLPVDPLQTALPSTELSTFLAAIFSTSLADRLRTEPRTTLLLPDNEAFDRLGRLVSAHLLFPSSQPDLEHVIQHHAIAGVEYTQALLNGSQQTYATLDGTDLHVERLNNGSVVVRASGGWAGMKAQITPRNMLTRTGVIHELSDILLPRSVNLTIGKLVRAAKGSTMASLVVKAGMEWVLNGTAPPEDSEWANEEFRGVGWTLLCPTDDAFKGVNLTELYNYVNLKEIVSQHLIPTPIRKSAVPSVWTAMNNNRPILIDDSATYTTLQSNSSLYGDVVFRTADPVDGKDGGYVVGIKGARGTESRDDWARVMAWGRSTTGGGTGGVIQIDRVLVPYRPPWWVEYCAPAAVGIGGFALIALFFAGVRAIWRRDTTEATYEPVGGYDPEEDA